MRIFLIGLATFVGLMVLGWIIQGNNFFLYKVFAPMYEQVRRETFEQSKAYRQGMIQELQNMQFQYEQASEESKPALRKIILHRTADFDMEQSDVPSDLATFVKKLRKEEVGQ